MGKKQEEGNIKSKKQIIKYVCSRKDFVISRVLNNHKNIKMEIHGSKSPRLRSPDSGENRLIVLKERDHPLYLFEGTLQKEEKAEKAEKSISEEKYIVGEIVKQEAERCFCKCSKSRCKKRYCECHNRNLPCTSRCSCTNCENQMPDFTERNKSQEGHEKKSVEVKCGCKKSNCTKKYCECANNSERCTSSCSCTNCKNKLKGIGSDSADNERDERMQGKWEGRRTRRMKPISNQLVSEEL